MCKMFSVQHVLLVYVSIHVPVTHLALRIGCGIIYLPIQLLASIQQAINIRPFKRRHACGPYG